MARIGIIGDVHEPASHPGYFDFCYDTFEAWGCDTFVFIGDIIDLHAISFHDRHPDQPGAADELDLAFPEVQRWYEAFPEAKVCIGNHDERVVRLAQTVNIPRRLIKDYAEIWETPGWDWKFEHTIDDVYFTHGTGCGGMHPAFNAMKSMCTSVVMGHVHTAGGVKWLVNQKTRLFGMDVGCGIDDRSAAFDYGRFHKRRSVLSCGVIIDGHPYHEMMPCGRGEPYDRNGYTKGKK